MMRSFALEDILLHLNIWRQTRHLVTLAPSVTNVPALGLSEYKPGGPGWTWNLATKH